MKNRHSFLTVSGLNETQISAVAKVLAQVFKQGDTVAINGDLGAGKSTLCRSIIKTACGADSTVPSPTFTLVQTYDTDNFYPDSACDIWHMDWYRIKQPQEVLELGVEEAFNDCICLIEWASKAEQFLPNQTLYIDLIDDSNTMDSTTRTISFAGDSWKDRLHQHIFSHIKDNS